MTRPITWPVVRNHVATLHEDLAGALARANEAVLNPPDGLRLDRIYVDAYAELRAEVDGIAALAERLLETLAESAPPARPLEAVLADIEAEGHGDWEVNRYESSELVYCRSRLASPRYPFEATAEELAAWLEQTERGEASGKSATEAAKARLAQIRVLRSEKAAHVIEAVLHEQAVGETDIGDTRAVLVDPLDTIADAFAARRMDDEGEGR